jgi:hypothetical protein
MTNKAASKHQCKKIAQYINTLAYSTADDPGNYKVTYDIKSGKIAEIKFDDSGAKQPELHLQKIIPKIIAGVSNKSSWLECQSKISAIIETLGQKQEFTDEQISKLQLNIDDWNAKWVELCGRGGLTNYTHLLNSFHVTYCLKRLRNIYRCSNQGWEYQNSQVNYVYMHRTNHREYECASGGRRPKMKHVG